MGAPPDGVPPADGHPTQRGWAEDVGRDGAWVEWTAPERVYVHQNETVSTYITLHNKADENQAFTIEALSIPAPLTTVGLPATELLVPNHLKQIAFGIRAPLSATYQNLTVSFSITSDLHPELNETVEMSVAIVPRSNLSFGVDDFAAFTVDELVRTAVAVNITNNASLSDDVTFNLYTDSDWSWGWNMPDVNGNEAFTTLAPDTLAYVYLWIDVPAVENGAPLAETGPRFILSAVSGLDMAVETWTFDLLMNEEERHHRQHRERLTSLQIKTGVCRLWFETLETPPTRSTSRCKGLRRRQPLPNTPKADRFNSSGWVVALFGGLEDIVLQPNESRVLKSDFKPPTPSKERCMLSCRSSPMGRPQPSAPLVQWPPSIASQRVKWNMNHRVASPSYPTSPAR